MNETTSGRQPQRFRLNIRLAGDLVMDGELSRRSAWSLTSRFEGSQSAEFQLTEDAARQLQLGFTITARSQLSAEVTGRDYANQICDLLAAVTSTAMQPIEDGVPTTSGRPRTDPAGLCSQRELTKAEWDWVADSLLRLKINHPVYLAAAGWFRRGLLTEDPFESFCCCFQVIERIALGYGREPLPDVDDVPAADRQLLASLATDLCTRTLRRVHHCRDQVLSKDTAARQRSDELCGVLPEVRAAAGEVLCAVQRIHLCPPHSQRMR